MTYILMNNKIIVRLLQDILVQFIGNNIRNDVIDYMTLKPFYQFNFVYIVEILKMDSRHYQTISNSSFNVEKIKNHNRSMLY